MTTTSDRTSASSRRKTDRLKATADEPPSRLEAARALLAEHDVFHQPDPYTQDCPGWCVGDHRATISPGDRTHLMNTHEGARDVPLELEEGVIRRGRGRYDFTRGAAHVGLEMWQEPREVEPEIRITGYVRDRWVLRLTLDEAEALRDELDRVVKLGRKG